MGPLNDKRVAKKNKKNNKKKPEKSVGVFGTRLRVAKIFRWNSYHSLPWQPIRGWGSSLSVQHGVGPRRDHRVRVRFQFYGRRTLGPSSPTVESDSLDFLLHAVWCRGVSDTV